MPLSTLVIEAAPDNVHGVVSRWLTKIGPATYVGHMSARVRDTLWREIETILDDGRATLVYADQNEQGFSLRGAGPGRYVALDLDGLVLVALDSEDHGPVTTP